MERSESLPHPPRARAPPSPLVGAGEPEGGAGEARPSAQRARRAGGRADAGDEPRDANVLLGIPEDFAVASTVETYPRPSARRRSHRRAAWNWGANTAPAPSAATYAPLPSRERREGAASAPVGARADRATRSWSEDAPTRESALGRVHRVVAAPFLERGRASKETYARPPVITSATHDDASHRAGAAATRSLRDDLWSRVESSPPRHATRRGPPRSPSGTLRHRASPRRSPRAPPSPTDPAGAHRRSATGSHASRSGEDLPLAEDGASSSSTDEIDYDIASVSMRSASEYTAEGVRVSRAAARPVSDEGEDGNGATGGAPALAPPGREHHHQRRPRRRRRQGKEHAAVVDGAPAPPPLARTAAEYASPLAPPGLNYKRFPRLIGPMGELAVERTGLKVLRIWYYDAFTTIFNLSWKLILLLFAVAYTVSFLLFGLIWWGIWRASGEDCISNVRGDADGFQAAFQFSIETQSTLGYGFKSLNNEGTCPQATIVLLIQLVVGFLLDAVLLGLVYAKITRPEPRATTLLISKVAVVAPRRGRLQLMVRLGDQQRTLIAEPQVRMLLFDCLPRRTPEGEDRDYRMWELDSVVNEGSNTQLSLIMPAIVSHTIDEHSPLAFWYLPGPGRAPHIPPPTLQLVISVSGTAVESGNPVTSRRSILPDEILVGRVFEPMLRHRYSRSRGAWVHCLDFRKFDETRPLPVPTKANGDASGGSSGVDGQSPGEGPAAPGPSVGGGADPQSSVAAGASPLLGAGGRGGGPSASSSAAATGRSGAGRGGGPAEANAPGTGVPLGGVEDESASSSGNESWDDGALKRDTLEESAWDSDGTYIGNERKAFFSEVKQSMSQRPAPVGAFGVGAGGDGAGDGGGGDASARGTQSDGGGWEDGGPSGGDDCGAASDGGGGGAVSQMALQRRRSRRRRARRRAPSQAGGGLSLLFGVASGGSGGGALWYTSLFAF